MYSTGALAQGAQAPGGDSPYWVICDVGNGRFLGGGKWGRGVWLCWVAFRKVEVVTGCLNMKPGCLERN